MSDNLLAMLVDALGAERNGPFLRVPGRDVVTYGETLERSALFAGVLRDHGAGPGERIAVQVEKSSDAIALYLACLRIGAVYLPLNTAYTGGEVDHFLTDAEPRVFVARPGAHPNLPADMSPCAVLDLGTDDSGTLCTLAGGATAIDDIVDRRGDDVAAMLYTSGTTGRPKGALLTHRNLAANARALFEVWGWQRDDVLLHALPVFHVHGLFVALHCAMLGGSTVEFLPRFDTEAICEAIPRATVMMGVPTFYGRLLSEPSFDRTLCGHMRLFVSGSAPLPENVFGAFERHTGHRVLERYGMTETGILTSNPLDGDRIGGTVGFPLPGVEVRVCDEEDRPLPAGEIGSVQVRGPGVFAGYWRLPEKTAAEFLTDGFFRTGDLGSLDGEGRLTLAGRAGDLIISGGLNVYPKEVELCLDELPDIAESAVVGLPDPDFGEAVTAFVVPANPGGDAPELETIRAALRDRLAGFKQPRRLMIVDQLPRNAMGKVEKARLRRDAGDAPDR